MKPHLDRSRDPAPPGAPERSRHGGLCPRCVHVKEVRSARGSVFLLCRLAAEDARFSKYPPQPVFECSGHRGPGGEHEA
jgi:hypothetical protein